MKTAIRRLLALPAVLVLAAAALVAGGPAASAWLCPGGPCTVTTGPRCYEIEGKCVVTMKLPYATPQGGGTVSWRTEDGTAEAPSDYVADRGQVELQPDSTEVQVEVAIKRDTPKEADEQFAVVHTVRTKKGTVAVVVAVTIADAAAQG